jgi:hypothetical protein
MSGTETSGTDQLFPDAQEHVPAGTPAVSGARDRSSSRRLGIAALVIVIVVVIIVVVGDLIGAVLGGVLVIVQVLANAWFVSLPNALSSRARRPAGRRGGDVLLDSACVAPHREARLTVPGRRDRPQGRRRRAHPRGRAGADSTVGG